MAELVYLLLIAVAVIAGIGAVGLVALLTWRWRYWQEDAARATSRSTEP